MRKLKLNKLDFLFLFSKIDCLPFLIETEEYSVTLKGSITDFEDVFEKLSNLLIEKGISSGEINNLGLDLDRILGLFSAVIYED